jgi:hypothetical protein
MTIIQKIAKNCVAAVGDLKGKKRDEMTIAYWLGAWASLQAVDHENAEWVGRVTTLLIATRGYSEALRMANEAEAA